MRARQAGRARRWTPVAQHTFAHLPRILLGAVGVLGLLVLTAPIAHADDCASLGDCFATVSTAAQVIAGVAVIVAASALALPSILRATRGPTEVSEAGVETDAQGQGQTQAAGTASGGNQGLNMPNLPDTPDLPLAPELSGMMGTGAAGESDTRGAREYTSQALEAMRTLGLRPADIESVIQTGAAALGNAAGTTVYSSPQMRVAVAVDAMTGRVLAVGRS